MFGFDIGYIVIAGAFGLLSMFISNRLKSKFKKYSKVHLRNGMSGAEIAEKMLADHGIQDVKVVSTPGMLTDHYNPANKTVNLSEGVYGQRHASAAAVAAHECGHAVQHAKAYSWLKMRSNLVPILNVTSRFSMWIIFGGLLLMGTTAIGGTIAWIGVALYGIGTMFSFITLPVEYDASNRALAWLKNKNMVSQEEYAGAEDALKWAARTYVVAAIGALATLLYFAMRVASRD
ncbi:MAG: hypothetical protein COA50_09730 [Flavobacteriaceae bacterium]|nr:MAG: hypothetical protein COA50_09730 [Flavobacteriaceae bacterium]